MHVFQTPHDYLFNLYATNSSEAYRMWKNQIKEKWNYKCAYCGSEHNLTLDHIIPRSSGGSNKISNVLCACKSCNMDKGKQFWSTWYLAKDFFTTERLSAILEWQSQNNKSSYEFYNL